MKRIILIALVGLGSLTDAQQNNEKLHKELENKRVENRLNLDLYLRNRPALEFLGEEASELEYGYQQYLKENQSSIAFFFGGVPYFLKSEDTDQIKNNNVDALHDGEIKGLNRTFKGDNIHFSVFDGGRAYEQHVDYEKENSTEKRVTNKEAATVAYSSHATGVTGMIGGKGRDLRYQDGTSAGNTRGMAPHATFDVYSFSETTLLNETTPKTVGQKLLGSLANISNHSYGVQVGWDFLNSLNVWLWKGEYDPNLQQAYSLNGTYLDKDREYDDIVYNNPSMIVVKSAGNSYGDGPFGSNLNKYYFHNGNVGQFNDTTDAVPGNNCSEGFDCIGPGSLAKNLIIVGSTEKITSNNKKYAQASDVVKSSFSSAGPRDDGAIKPDIAGVGSDILHASTSATGSVAWGLGSGTSYSAPQVTGIIGLWTEINKSLFNNELLNAASAKTLLAHSALEAGNKGPDVWFGWGFADAKKGAELLVDKSNNKIIFEDKTLENNTKYEFLVESDGKQPLKATISWIDPSYKNIISVFPDAHNNRTSNLVNDLDLRIVNLKTNEIFYPWKLNINDPMAPATTGDNVVDNIEQVLIENPTAGTYKVEVSHKGNLVNNEVQPAVAPQNYSILVTGYSKIISNDTRDTSGFIIYPTLMSNNDTDKIVTISYTKKKISSVEVYDMAGRLLKTDAVNSHQHTLNFGSYTTGVYLVNIKLDHLTEPITRKVMIR